MADQAPAQKPEIKPLTGAEAKRLRWLLDANGNGAMPDGGLTEMRGLLARWTAAHEVWSDRLYNPAPNKGRPD